MTVLSQLKNFRISSSKLILLTSIYIILVDNNVFWSKFIDVTSGGFFYKILVLFSFASFFILFLYLVISIFSFKKSTRYTLVIFLITSSIISYYIDEFGTIISVSMIQNLMQTDMHEALDLMSLNFIIHILTYGLLPSVLVFYIKTTNSTLPVELKNRIGMIFLLLIITSTSVFITFKDVTYIGRENKNLKHYINPIYPILSTYKYIKPFLKAKSNNRAIDKTYKDASIAHNTNNTKPNKTVLVVVIGETARAKNFGLNGHTNNTTPQLNEMNIINYPNTYSCGTATAESLPCMFSNITHENYNLDNIRQQDNMLDALSYADINVLWRENNSGCKGVCSKNETEIMHITGDEILCNGKECFDEILLKNLNTRISETDNNMVIFLHQQGSHGPAYYKRTPEEFKKFKPICSTKALQDCSDTEIQNSYDNTILYTDHLLSSIINILKNTEDTSTAMIYMSDHGESLGENGVYLHGLPYFMAPEEQIRIPFIVWLSSNIKQSKQISQSCLIKNSRKQFSHDNLTHSVLGLMDVRYRAYDQKLDIFSSCRPTLPYDIKAKNIVDNKK